MTFLIWSNQHKAWWKPNRVGYTKSVREAGRYPLITAIDICEGANWNLGYDQDEEMVPDETMVPINE